MTEGGGRNKDGDDRNKADGRIKNGDRTKGDRIKNGTRDKGDRNKALHSRTKTNVGDPYQAGHRTIKKNKKGEDSHGKHSNVDETKTYHGDNGKENNGNVMVTNLDNLHQAKHRANKEKNEAVTNLGDSHQDENNVNVTVANLDNLHQAGHRANKEKNEAVTNLGNSYDKEKNEVGRELQVRTTTGARGGRQGSGDVNGSNQCRC